MEHDDDLTAADEIRLLRQDQQMARRSVMILVLVLLVVAAAAYPLWSADRDADNLSECLRRTMSVEQC